MIDEQGLRSAVGIILCNRQKQLLIAQRTRQAGAWQFPQGGVHSSETPLQAMWRELHEELGLLPEHTKLLHTTPTLYTYRIPKALRRKSGSPICVGQKQQWFLLQLTAPEHHINLTVQAKPEFSHWKWVDYWSPVHRVIGFKREMYQQVLTDYEPYLA